MFEHGPSDRVQIRSLGTLMSPAVCLLCGNGTSLEGYVDLDTFFEWEGQMYLCMTCTKQIAEMIGCIVPDEADILKEQFNSTAKELLELREQHESDKLRLDNYDHAIRVAFADVSDGSDNGDNNVETPQPVASEPADVGAEQQPEPTKPSTSEQRTVPTRTKRSNTPSFNV